jgi:2-polyprenyl-3-methyl-5-hydroxy-6-metoxy-1,4-benzoquinol methylase
LKTNALDYLLGHSDAELHRLRVQAELLDDLTEDMLRRAGIAAGMHVLDLGTGAGDVALLAARMVGPTGRVLGVDRATEAVETAWRRSAAAGSAPVSFEVADLAELAIGAHFDVVVGRLVLAYVADPVHVLRRAAAHLRPGGALVIQEIDLSTARSQPRLALYHHCLDWIQEVFLRSGLVVNSGQRLHRLFRDAGLPAPRMVASARADAGADAPIYDYIAATVRSLLPAMGRFGVATEAEVDVDSLGARLRAEAAEADALVVAPSFIGAWARVA